MAPFQMALSLHGRTSRRTFWLSLLCLIGAYVALTALPLALSAGSVFLHLPVLAYALSAANWIFFVLLGLRIKRRHDRDVSNNGLRYTPIFWLVLCCIYGAYIFAASVLMAMFAAAVSLIEQQGSDSLTTVVGICYGLCFIALITYPSLSIWVKRLHDRDMSGAILCNQLIPIAIYVLAIILRAVIVVQIGEVVALVIGIWLLVQCGFLRGTSGSNQFGFEPVPSAGSDMSGIGIATAGETAG
jgi:uncharacterized membrane protein YhaH (DUF805 family)